MEVAKEITLALAGLSGSFVFAFIRPDPRLLHSIGSIASGAVTSFFVAPWICDWRDLNSIHGQHAVAFAVGLLGMLICRGGVASMERMNLGEILMGMLKIKPPGEDDKEKR